MIVETMNGPRELRAGVPPPPPGWRRCFFCHEGVLIEDSEEAEAEHRWRFAPRQADPERYFRERSHDVEDDARDEFEMGRRGPGLTMGAVIARMPF